MTRVADSTFIIALFDEKDSRTEQATKWAQEPETVELIPEVLGETLGAIHRRKGFRPALEIWHELRRIPHFRLVESTNMAKVSSVFGASKGKLTWVDAAVVARCRATGGKPLAFDDEISDAV